MKPWLLLPSKWSYILSPFALKIYSRIKPFKNREWRSFSWRGLYFPNPLGTAGGVDKNALHTREWWALGAGFLEVGTITPEPQKANPSKILDRSLKHRSLWNNMGFPNRGLNFVKEKLSGLPENKPTPLFVNIGKNRQTSLEQAVEDYRKILFQLHTQADVFVINVSSPNTESLRSLLSEKKLPKFLQSLKGCISNFNLKTPLILKISPDEKNFYRILEQSIESDIDGWCICNSTTERKISGLFPDYGGVSGKLLADQSLNLLKKAKNYLDKMKVKDKLLISCGGVLTAQDVFERLEEGAHLVQVYSALVFEGPGFFKSVAEQVPGKGSGM